MSWCPHLQSQLAILQLLDPDYEGTVILHVRNYSPNNTVTYQKSSIFCSIVAEPQDLLLYYALNLIAILENNCC
jgi:hypothetical protein